MSNGIGIASEGGVAVSEDGNTVLAKATELVIGENVSATVTDTGEVTLTAGLGAENDGAEVLAEASSINFGTGVTATADGDGTVTVTASSGVDVEDGGTTVLSGATGINFGDGLSASDDGDGTTTVSASGGGGGSITSAKYKLTTDEDILESEGSPPIGWDSFVFDESGGSTFAFAGDGSAQVLEAGTYLVSLTIAIGSTNMSSDSKVEVTLRGEDVSDTDITQVNVYGQQFGAQDAVITSVAQLSANDVVRARVNPPNVDITLQGTSSGLETHLSIMKVA